jgi:hypothetical protein
MRHGGTLWSGPSLSSLSHSLHRYSLAETRFGIGSDRPNRSAWSAPISPIGTSLPAELRIPRPGLVFPPVNQRNHRP